MEAAYHWNLNGSHLCHSFIAVLLSAKRNGGMSVKMHKKHVCMSLIKC